MHATSNTEILARYYHHYGGHGGGHLGVVGAVIVTVVVLALMIGIAVYAYRKQSRTGGS